MREQKQSSFTTDETPGEHVLQSSTRLRYAAAILSLAAAVIHGLVVPEHYDEWWGYGLFFLVVALAQAFYSGALLRWPRPSLFILGIAGNLAIIMLYTVTRTVGIPLFGPHAGEVEDVGGIDLLSKMVELVLVTTLVALLRASRQRHVLKQA